MSSHRTVRSPSREERQQLERMTREEIGRVAMRAQMVLLSARSFTAQEIAEIQSIADVTVYKWLNRFDEGGPEGLTADARGALLNLARKPRKRSSASSKSTEEGYATRWTAPRLARHLEEELVAVHPETDAPPCSVGSVPGESCRPTRTTPSTCGRSLRQSPRPA